MRATSRRIASRRSFSTEQSHSPASRSDLALEQRRLVHDHGERIVDLVGETDRDLAQGRELVLAADLAQVLRIADRAVFDALVVIEDRAGDRDGNVLPGASDEGRLERLDPGLTAVLGTPHRAPDPARLVDRRIEEADEFAEHLLGLVAEGVVGAVVEVDDAPLAIGGDDDVGRAIRESLELILRETRLRETHRSAPLR